jgi:glyoxylase-like metal-dependent hydrolase (beta-lactamase superfamily II)
MTVTGLAQRQAWLDNVLPPVETVRPGLWSVPVPLPESPLRYVSMYVVEVPGGVAVVDTGWPVEVAWSALTDGLVATGHALTDVRAVLVTHAHSDHHGLAGRLRDASGAWIGLHPLEAEHVTRVLPRSQQPGRMRAWLLRCGAPTPEVDAIESHMGRMGAVVSQLATPDRLIEDGSRPLGPGVPLRAVWTPGHTPGHLCFYDEGRDLLLSGDHVLPRISPNIALNSLAEGNPLRDFLASLHKVAALDPVEVLPAHEYRFAGLRARVEGLVAHHDARMAEIEAVLRDEPGATTWAVATRLTWSRPWEQNTGAIRQSAVAETLAHLVHLAELGRVEDGGGDVDRWTLVRR